MYNQPHQLTTTTLEVGVENETIIIFLGCVVVVLWAIYKGVDHHKRDDK